MMRAFGFLVAMLMAPMALMSAPFVINPGIGGTWFNPEQDGQGFLVDVVPGAPPVLVLAWYTYDVDGGTQAWLFGTGPIEGQDTVVVDLLKPTGGVFDDSTPVDKVPWGTAEVRFESCLKGLVDYRSADGGLSGTIAIDRLTSDALCRELDETGSRLYTATGHIGVDNGGVTLATSLMLPAGQGPFPVVVLVHGSGPVTRANVQFIADLLLQRELAVLSYDKRGVGASGGTFVEAGFGPRLALLADDIGAMVDVLRHHAAIDHRRMGLLGISQGGWINAMVAAGDPRLAFMVNVVGPVVTVGEEIHYSNQTDQGATIAQATAAVRSYQGVHGYDPVPDLARVAIPGLWVLGGMDRSIPTEITMERLQVLIDGGSPFEIQFYPDANHGMRDPQGSPIPYLTPPGGVIDWIVAAIQ